MRHDPRVFDRRHLDFLTGLISNARQLDAATFHAANATATWPHLHRCADFRGVGVPKMITRRQLASSDNPWQIGVSRYI